MNPFLIAGAVLFAGGFGAWGYVLFKRMPQVRLVDPDTGKDHRQRKLREKLMEERLQRSVSGKVQVVKRSLSGPAQFIRDIFRRFAGKLVAIERSYTSKRNAAVQNVSAEELQAIVVEAERMIREEKYDKAEERLVEVISASPKHASAYELLGRLYIEQKQYDEAKESMKCYVKLKPQEPEGHFLYAQVHEALKDKDAAYKEYAAALGKMPNNPKYLDAFIEMACEVGKTDEAKEAFERLRQVNPENKKIPGLMTFFGEDEDKGAKKKK